MKKVLTAFLRPVAVGLETAAGRMQDTSKLAASRIEDFLSDPVGFIPRHPLTSVLALVGGASALSATAAFTGSAIITAALSPIVVPVGLGVMGLKVAAFTGFFYGAIDTIRTGYGHAQTALGDNGAKAAKSVQNSYASLKKTAKRVAPNWAQKPFQGGFNKASSKPEPKPATPAPAPAPKINF